MNILFLGYEYPPNGGGVGSYMRNMAQALAQHGHHAVVLCGRVEGLPDDTVESGVLVMRRYDRHEAGSESVGRLALDLVKSHPIDLIEGADHLGECAWLLNQKQRPPILIKAHSGQFIRVLHRAQAHYPWQRMTLALARARARRQIQAERFVMRRADALLSPSQRLMDELSKQGIRLPSHRAVIPNPIFATAGEVASESGRPTLLFVGRIEFLKGIAFLPDVLRAVRDVLPDTVLELVGGDTYARGIGSVQGWLEKRFADQADHVIFRGRLHGDELRAAYQRSWVVLHPSLWDNFPTVLLEAMSEGKPVVSTPHGGMPEMLQDTGCPIEDPRGPAYAGVVVGLMCNKAMREKIGQSARRRVMSEYNPKRVADQYVAFAKKIV